MSSENSDIPEADTKHYSLMESPLQHKNLNDTDTLEIVNNVQATMEQSEEFSNDCQVNSDKKHHVTQEKLSVELKVAFEELREQIKIPKNDENVVKNHSVSWQSDNACGEIFNELVTNPIKRFSGGSRISGFS